jgi:hypothetical protein
MKDFAKLFRFDDIGQVLVVLDESDAETRSGPELRFSFMTGNQMFGITQLITSFKDSDQGWDDAEKAFDGLTEETVRKLIDPTISQVNSMFPDEAIAERASTANESDLIPLEDMEQHF